MIRQRYALVLAAAGLTGLADRAAAQMAIFPPPNQSPTVTRSYGSGGLFRSRSVQTWTRTPGYVPARTVAPSVVTTYSSPPAVYSAPSVRSVAPQGYTATPPGLSYTATPYGVGAAPAVPSVGYTATPYGVGYTPPPPGVGYRPPPPPAAVYYAPR